MGHSSTHSACVALGDVQLHDGGVSGRRRDDFGPDGALHHAASPGRPVGLRRTQLRGLRPHQLCRNMLSCLSRFATCCPGLQHARIVRFGRCTRRGICKHCHCAPPYSARAAIRESSTVSTASYRRPPRDSPAPPCAWAAVSASHSRVVQSHNGRKQQTNAG